MARRTLRSCDSEGIALVKAILNDPTAHLNSRGDTLWFQGRIFQIQTALLLDLYTTNAKCGFAVRPIDTERILARVNRVTDFWQQSPIAH